MNAILELEISPQQERLLKKMLTAMNITFKSQFVEKNEPYSEKEIVEQTKSPKPRKKSNLMTEIQAIDIPVGKYVVTRDDIYESCI